jgi:hypothetical protein
MARRQSQGPYAIRPAKFEFAAKPARTYRIARENGMRLAHADVG